MHRAADISAWMFSWDSPFQYHIFPFPMEKLFEGLFQKLAE
jgi:hypothetical protein